VKESAGGDGGGGRGGAECKKADEVTSYKKYVGFQYNLIKGSRNEFIKYLYITLEVEQIRPPLRGTRRLTNQGQSRTYQGVLHQQNDEWIVDAADQQRAAAQMQQQSEEPQNQADLQGKGEEAAGSRGILGGKILTRSKIQ
jgi:hypothetical protein